MAAQFRIVGVPPGEAPQWVREKWVGLCLPLRQRGRAPGSYYTFGVLSGPKTLFAVLVALVTRKLKRETGYSVSVRVAVDALAAHSPEAAAWWRENAPHMFQPTRFFVFGSDVAVVVDE